MGMARSPGSRAVEGAVVDAGAVAVAGAGAVVDAATAAHKVW